MLKFNEVYKIRVRVCVCVFFTINDVYVYVNCVICMWHDYVYEYVHDVHVMYSLPWSLPRWTDMKLINTFASDMYLAPASVFTL